MAIRRFAPLIPTLAVILIPAPAAARSYHAERFDVLALLDRDGSARVTETIVFRFTDGEFTRVFREVPVRNTDGVDIEQALLDGIDVTGAVRVSRRTSGVRVTWMLPPTSNAVREFTLVYRLRGVVTQGIGRDTLAWTPLPSEHDYRILASRVAIQLPPGASFDGAPVVSSPAGKNRRRVAVRASLWSDRAEFGAAEIGGNGTFTVRLATGAGQLTQAMPAWQRLETDRQARAPVAATIAGAAALLGLTLLVVMWRNAPRPDAAVPRHVPRQSDPPDSLAPALAGALRKGGRADTSLGLAALFDLARRNVVRIEEQQKQSRWSPRTFMVVRRDAPAGLPPHERELLALAFPDAQTRSTKLADVAMKLNMKGAGFRKAVAEELRRARWVDEERVAARKRLYKVSGMILVLAGASAAGAVLTLDYWGAWGFMVPIALAVVSVIGFILASTLSVLSDEGLRQALRWTGFARELKSLSKGHSGPSGDVLARWFAYGVAFGAGAALAKRLDAEGLTRSVEWLRALPGAEGGAHGAFVAMMSGSGGAGAAGGAGGAAGGGSSGAS